MTKTFLGQIAALAQRYKKEVLKTWERQRGRYRERWFTALDFFLQHVFYQGRRDELSEEYYRRAMVALTSYFGEGDDTQTSRLQDAWNAKWIPHAPAQTSRRRAEKPDLKRVGCGKGGKRRDQKMVLDTLRYVYHLPNHNIVAESLRRIKAGEILAHQDDLQSICQIGPKTSAFYLRDLCSLYDVELDPS